MGADGGQDAMDGEDDDEEEEEEEDGGSLADPGEEHAGGTLVGSKI